MKDDREQETIKAWFRDLRSSEARSIPPFAEVWEAAAGHALRPRSRAVLSRLAVAVAMLVLLAAPAIWWRNRHAEAKRSQVAAVPIANWKSPTAFLIDTPGREMLRTTPRIGYGSLDMTRYIGSQK